MPLFIPNKSNYIGDKNLISIGVVELGSHDLDLSHFGGKHISYVHFHFCIIHRSALFLVLGKELTISKNNMPFKLGFYIFTYFLIYPQAKNMPTQIIHHLHYR